MIIPVDLTRIILAQTLATQHLTVLPMPRSVSVPWESTSVSASILSALFPAVAAVVVMMAMPAQLMLTAQLLDQSATIACAVHRPQAAQILAIQPQTALSTLVFASIPLVSTSAFALIQFALGETDSQLERGYEPVGISLGVQVQLVLRQGVDARGNES